MLKQAQPLSVTAAGANRSLQRQRGNAPCGVEFAVRDPAVPGKVRVGFLEEVTAEGATSAGGRVPGPKDGPGGESFLSPALHPLGAAAVPGPEGGSPGRPGSCASPRMRLRPALEPPMQEAPPGRGSFTRKRTTRPRPDGQTGKEARPTQGSRQRHRPTRKGPYPTKCLAFIRGGEFYSEKYVYEYKYMCSMICPGFSDLKDSAFIPGGARWGRGGVQGPDEEPGEEGCPPPSRLERWEPGGELSCTKFNKVL